MVALAALFRTSVEALEGGQGFVVPDPPSRTDLGRQAREYPRSVGLPAAEGEAVTVVDLRDGSSKGKQISEAMMAIVQGVKEGRKVWVVLE